MWQPQALNNFLALLGWNPGDDREIFSMDKLIELFSLDRVNKAGAVFNTEKLDWMNQQYIQAMEDAAYLKEARQWLSGTVLNDRGDAALLAIKSGLTRFDEIPDKLAPFVSRVSLPQEGEAAELMAAESTRTVLQALKEKLQVQSLDDPAGFFPLMKGVQKETGIKGKNLWMPVRIALTGEIHGPELGVIAFYLGNKEMIRRLETALKGL
jgi:glutamyl/glutaminyl-tRNA synthetase